MSFALTFPAPPSVNGIWKPIVRGGKAGLVKTETYAAWITHAGWVISIQRPKPAPVHGNFTATIIVDERLRDSNSDVDNRVKGSLDILATMYLIDNDKLCDRLVVEWGKVNEPFPGTRCVHVAIEPA